MTRLLLLFFSSAIFLSAQEIEIPATVPAHLKNRCSEELRLREIKTHGGKAASEEAVVAALRFLVHTQHEMGYWSSERQRPIGMTSLGLLCFLGHGETTEAKEFGPAVKKAITYLIKSAVRKKGKMASDFHNERWPFEHALATYALAEAYSLCEVGYREEIPQLRRAVEVCGQILIDHQHKSGGWAYLYRKDNARGGTTHLTAWHLLALRACADTSLKFHRLKAATKRGLDFLERYQLPSGAFTYSGGRLLPDFRQVSNTAIAVAAFSAWEPRRRACQKGARFLGKHLSFDWDKPNSDLFALTFASQAMFSHDREKYQAFRKSYFPQLLENQAPGGFFLEPNHGEKDTIEANLPSFVFTSPYGTHYRTCLAILLLETDYRCPERRGPVKFD